MRCIWCGYTFDLTEAQEACRACPLAWGCRLVRCPRCGYEMVPEAMLLRAWRRILSHLRQAKGRTHARAERPADGGAE